MRKLLLLLALVLLPGCRQALDVSDLLAAGPMLGYSTQREVFIWVQTRRPARVQIRYWPEEKPGFARTTPPVRTTVEGDLVAHLRASNLDPGVRYKYRVWINGTQAERPYPMRFQTEPLWQWRSGPPEFSVAIGSCAYINDEPFDRPGEPYGGGYEIFPNILRKLPDLMIWLGDNVYLREVDWTSPGQMAYRYAHTRRTPEMQPLLANVHNYALWDDHDYGPDNSDRSFVLKGAALQIFQRYWGNPSYGLPELAGTFGHFSWGDADFFLLDDRTYRHADSAPESEAKAMWGPAQMDWLIDALTASRATFKIVANGSQILNPFPRSENAIRFPSERQRLLDALQQRGIEGVVLLTGDRHFTELQRLERPGSYPLYEYTSSPLTSGVSAPRGDEESNPQRVEGTLLRERNFGILTFSGPVDERVLTLKAFSSAGEPRWEHRIYEQKLRKPL